MKMLVELINYIQYFNLFKNKAIIQFKYMDKENQVKLHFYNKFVG